MTGQRTLKKSLSALKHTVLAWQDATTLRQVISDWRALRINLVKPPVSGRVRRLLLVPSDVHTLVGAKGDEAMMQAAVQQLARLEPELRVGVITATPEACRAARGLGFEPLTVWGKRLLPMLRAVDAFAPDAVLVVGADIMDGYYGALAPGRMLALADLLARRGVRAVVLGFSFNREPAAELRPLFDGLSPQLQLNLRDQRSLARFNAFSNASTRLVADVAFLLEPDHGTPAVGAIRAWSNARRAAGDLVLAVNLHPLLLAQRTPENLRALTDSAITALHDLLEARPVSVLLLSHDYRRGEGDHACLGTLHERLRAKYSDRILYPVTPMSAAELKAVAGTTDGVITGRMHLAIAALGMGVPVAALTYQDKFQGLFAHFGLPEKLLLPPAEATDPARLKRLFDDFLSELSCTRETVQRLLPQVREAALRNLQGLL